MISRAMFVLFSGWLAAAPAAGPDLKAIEVTFKFDPGPTYGGVRWLSPPYTSGLQGGTGAIVEARVQGVDSQERRVPLSPEWSAGDPGMVVVSPVSADQFRIAVKHPGQTSLKAAAQGLSKELIVKAEPKGKFIQVEVTEAPERAASKMSEKERLSYALGANLGNGLHRESIDVEPGLVIQGLTDVLSGVSPLVGEHEVSAIVAGLAKELREKKVTAAARKIVAVREVADRNKKQGEEFLAGNRTKEGIVTLASGLQYRILKPGEGRKPALTDTVVCSYRGTYIDGTEFDSSYTRNQPATFALRATIPGWREALQLMAVGSKWQLFVPPKLAYGERGANSGIGPNATLIFEVELISIQDKS